MRVILWGMEVFGINGLPSVEVMKDIDQLLQSYCGVDTIRYEGAFGHVYYVNHLGKLIAQVLIPSSRDVVMPTLISIDLIVRKWQTLGLASIFIISLKILANIWSNVGKLSIGFVTSTRH